LSLVFYLSLNDEGNCKKQHYFYNSGIFGTNEKIKMAAHRKRLVENLVSLSAVQGLSILFPLITFPYLIRILGVEGFGVFSLAQTFIMYFDLIVSFGFGLTATKRISANMQDELMVKKIIVAVYILKTILFSISFIIFIACSFTPFLQEHVYLLPISSFYLLGNMLFPDWYFQGIQKMKNITFVTIISKTVSLLLILVLVKEKTDIEYAVIAMSAGNMTAGVIAMILMFKSISNNFVLPNRTFIKDIFKESYYVFMSIIIAPLYSSVNIFILRIFTNPLMVGYYAVAEKILNAIGMLSNIINRTFYPHLSQLYTDSLQAYKKNINKLIVIIATIFFVFALIQFFGASLIIKFLFGKKSGEDISYSVAILKIMSVALIFSPFVSFFFQLMIIQEQKKESIINISIAVIANIIMGSVFTYLWAGKGLAVNLCLMVMLMFVLNRRSFIIKIKSLNT
jgi:polysaccharide transporter, PST family